MSREIPMMNDCASFEEALLEGRLSELHEQHVAGCAACERTFSMTRSLEDQLRDVPSSAGQRPQWLAELRLREARRRTRIFWTAGMVTAVAASIALVVALRASHPPSVTVARPVEVTPPARDVTAGRAAPANGPGRPTWVTSTVPFSGWCADDGSVRCVGISSERPTKEAALAEARDVALDELSALVGRGLFDRLGDSVQVRGLDARVKVAMGRRAALLERFQASSEGPRTAETTRLLERLADARHRAALALIDAGGPVRPSDFYWEEYTAEEGGGPRFVAYARYDVSRDLITSLRETFAATKEIVLEEEPAPRRHARPAFPLLAYSFRDFAGGVHYVSVFSGHPVMVNDAVAVAAGGEKLRTPAQLELARARGLELTRAQIDDRADQ